MLLEKKLVKRENYGTNNMITDILIFIANLIIFAAFIPSMFSKDKPHKRTSFLNVFATLLFIWAYIIAGFYLAVGLNILIGTCWLILLIQKL